MKKCPNCNALVSNDSLFCTVCGKELPKGNVCPHCGASVNDGDVFCANCGKKIIEKSVEQLEEQESPQIPNVSESNTSKKILPIIVGVIVFAILGAGWWSYKSSKEKANVNLDSLFTANLDEVKDNVEDVKFTKFREIFTIKNLLDLLNNPEDKSIAQKCGLTFLYKDTYEVEGYQDEIIDAYSIVYGYEVEQDKANDGTNHKYTGKAIGNHSCYFEYSSGRWESRTLYDSNKADADYFMEMLKNHGFTKEGGVFSNQKWVFYLPSESQRKGWYEISIRDC